jgi:hypothetical protein
MSKTPLVRALLAIALTATTSSLAAQNIVTNGSFEIGPNPGSWTSYGPGCIPGVSWCVGTGTADIVGTFWRAAEGSRSVELAATVPGSIYQDISTSIGEAYTLTFAMSGWPSLGRIYDLAVLWGGRNVGTFQWIVGANQSATNMMWSDRTITGLVASSATTRLEFQDVSNRGYNTAAALDNVRLVPATVVPEPSSYVLMLTGLLALGVGRWRSKHRVIQGSSAC